MLTIINEVRRNQRIMYLVRCGCGKEEIKRKDHVRTNRTTMCKSCASKKTALNYPPPVNRTGYEGLSGTHFLAIKFGASKRNIEFNLSEKFLWNLFLNQRGLCALTGIPIILNNSIKNQNVNWDIITASLDRKDSNGGYIESNVWWVHKKINRLKNNLSVEELLYWSKLLVDKHGNPDPSISNTIKVDMKEQRLGGEDVTNNPPTSAQLPNMEDDIV